MDEKPTQADRLREYRRAHSNPTRPLQFSLRGLLRLIVYVGLTVTLWNGCQRLGQSVTPIRFDSVAWKRADPIEDYRTVRNQMIGDLLSRRLLEGRTRAQVEILLGPPLEGPLDEAGVDGDRWHMAYYLGMERCGWASLDDEFLVIRFDSDGEVVEYGTAVN